MENVVLKFQSVEQKREFIELMSNFKVNYELSAGNNIINNSNINTLIHVDLPERVKMYIYGTKDNVGDLKNALNSFVA